MQPIADKNFLDFLGEPLIAHQLNALHRAGFKDILIVGGKHNMAELSAVAAELNSKTFRIDVEEQKDLDLGMAGAILAAEKWIDDEAFVVTSSNDVLGDDAYDVFKDALDKKTGAMLAVRVSSYFPGGYLSVGHLNKIEKIVEKPHPGSEPSDLVNVVLHYHANSKALLNALNSVSSSKDDRYEVALQKLLDSEIEYRAIPYEGFWQPVKYPWHVISLMNHFFEFIKPFRGKGVEIAKSAVIKGLVYLDDGVRVLDNAVIQGPAYIGKNSIVATNALVRFSHVGEACVIGFGSEVARSYLGSDVWLHTNYVGDSIIGNDVSFGAGTVTGNLRFDEQNIPVKIQENKVDCGTNKLGLITGDHIRTGINTSFMPGIKIGSNSCIGAGLVIAEDIEADSFVTGDTKLKIYKNRVQVKPRRK